jgi:hypothetical protein
MAMTESTTKKVDLLNTGLLLLSVALAYLFPFRLFLLSYAILGPLHYLTEINWLHQKKYFDKRIPWLLLGSIVIVFIVAPKLIQHAGQLETKILGPLAFWMDQFSNGLLFFCLWVAFSSILIRSHKWLLLSSTLGVAN